MMHGFMTMHGSIFVQEPTHLRCRTHSAGTGGGQRTTCSTETSRYAECQNDKHIGMATLKVSLSVRTTGTLIVSRLLLSLVFPLLSNQELESPLLSLCVLFLNLLVVFQLAE